MVWTVTANHGRNGDQTALGTISRALRGMAAHGFITDLNVYSGQDQTTWSYRAGEADGRGVRDGLLDVVQALAPDWVIEAEGNPPCGKIGHDSERIVWMCVLPDGHDGECSYEQRIGTMPPRLTRPGDPGYGY